MCWCAHHDSRSTNQELQYGLGYRLGYSTVGLGYGLVCWCAHNSRSTNQELAEFGLLYVLEQRVDGAGRDAGGALVAKHGVRFT